MRSWMKSVKMPITKIEAKCLTASEICSSNGWSVGTPDNPYYYLWRQTPSLQDMQMGEVGVNLSASMINGIYHHARNGKWICK